MDKSNDNYADERELMIMKAKEVLQKYDTSGKTFITTPQCSLLAGGPCPILHSVIQSAKI